MATYASTYGNPDWYKQQIDPKDAQSQANRLGISTDQLFQLYAQTNMPNIGQPGAGQPGAIPSGGLQPTQNQMAQWASGLGTDRAPGAPLPQLISAVPSPGGGPIQGMYGPMATWQNVTGGGQGNQSNQPPTWNQVGQGAGLSQSDINQFQAMGRTPAAIAQQFNVPGLGQGSSPQQTQFQVPQTVVPKLTGQTVVPTAQPVKQYQSGGLVTQDSSVPANIYGTQYPLYAQNAQGNPTGNAIYANPTNQASLLGAAALQMPVVINPPPSGTPSSKSGVAPTGGALIGTSTPQVGWGTGQSGWTALGQAAGFSPNDIAAFQRQGLTPDQVAKQFNVQSPLAGPWTNPQIGSVFTPVARTAPTMALDATPLKPAAQPTAAAYSPTPTPFAQAPPAPGLQIPQIPQGPLVAAHTNALADAGKALFAHFGGDPNSASPADIASFHSQLTATLGAPPQPIAWQQAWAGQHGLTNPTPGSPLPPGVTPVTPPQGAPPPPPKRMQSGGRVPGRGNEDTVPALLTPGEYVIPKQQVNQLMRTGRLPIKMADGGTVPDSDSNAPPETRRKTLTTPASGAPPSQTSSAPTAPTAPTGLHLASGLASAAQAYANSVGGGGGIPAGSTAGAGAYGTVGSLMAGQGSAGAAGSLGQAPATSGLSSPGAQGALGGVASGLNQAAQAIASSVKPWQMQQNAIPAPPPAPAAPQFAQQQIPQQTQQGGNQYAAYARNQAMYPTSPYYT